MIPFFALHPFFVSSAKQLHPVLGSRMRLEVHLQQPAKAFTRLTVDTHSYTLNNVRLHIEKVVLTSSFKTELQNMITRGEGVRCNFVDYKAFKHNPNGGATNVLEIQNHYNNAISLMLLEKPVLPAADAAGGRFPNLKCPLAHKFGNGKLHVKCGERSFTYGTNGVENQLELYELMEKFSQNFSNISGQGCISYEQYTGAAGFGPVVVSLQRFNIPDTTLDVINSGISANDEGLVSQINVDLTTTANIPNTSQLYAVLVYEKMLVIDAQGVRVMS